MSLAPNPAYHSSATETLADLRHYVSCYPEAVHLDPGELADRLGHPTVEIMAALEALTIEGEVQP